MNHGNYKFNIGDDPAISKAIQKRLIKTGCSWNGEKTVQFTDKPYLYVDNDCISFGTLWKTFDGESAQEINIDWMRPETRKTINVGDKTYYEDELAEALSKINEVE